jgi:hypothetical protein
VSPRGRERYRLPLGVETTDVDAYIEAWRALGRPLADAVGGVLHSYDPNVAIHVDGHIWTVPVRVAQRLVDRLYPGGRVSPPPPDHNDTPNRRKRVPRAGTPHNRRKASR